MLAVSSSTYRTDSEANRDGRGGPHREVLQHCTDLTVLYAPSGAFFVFYVPIPFIKAGELHEKENDNS